MNTAKELYDRWLAQPELDTAVAEELHGIAGDDAAITDRFYRDLEFGTGGLRGVLGAGTNRMNVYTVAKASQGLADYLKKNFAEPSVAIGYDSRIKSDVFAKVAAGVFAANGVKVNIWPVLMPVPTVSFATRYLHTSAGVMVTASHNPSKYNGYKVYGADGCQITTEAAAEILAEIEKLDIFADVETSDFEAGVAEGSIQYIPDEVYTAFVEQVKNQSVLFGEEVNKNVAIVYSPLNGTGLKPVTRTLKEMGYTNITVVKEQEQPDGNFPTCPYPNPEIKEAMALGMEYAKKCNADLLLATDPDCDRVGIAVKNKTGEYELLTGNQTGMLLLDYICSQRVKHGKMPAEQLEKLIMDFIYGEFDVLVSTTIVENGIDIPNANTIIVDNAQNFGLSDLHQLRGRVGRSNQKGYCYLLSPPDELLSSDARRRLRAIEEFSDLGSGFNIAMQDLDIRGAGNLLGAEQSGFIADIGFETYQKIMNEAVAELRAEGLHVPGLSDGEQEVVEQMRFIDDAHIDIEVEAALPDAYVSQQAERLKLYRELDSTKDEEALQAFESRLADRFGPLPRAAKELLNVVRLRWEAIRLGMERVKVKNGLMIVHFVGEENSPFYKSEAFMTLLQRVTQRPDRFVLKQHNNRLAMTVRNVKDVEDAYKTLQQL